MGGHALLQGVFPIQGSNRGLLHGRQILYHLSHQGNLAPKGGYLSASLLGTEVGPLSQTRS